MEMKAMKSKNRMVLAAILLMVAQTASAESFGGITPFKYSQDSGGAEGGTVVFEVNCKGMDGQGHSQKVSATADSRAEAVDMVKKQMVSSMFCRDMYDINLSVVK